MTSKGFIMSVNKLTFFSLSALFLVILLQISNAGDKTEVEINNSQPDTIVNIVDPTLITGTEVLLKDLF
jgi:hypothetical protein